MTELLDLLHSILGQSDEKNKSNFAFTCPFCRHYKKKLEISLASGAWHCWVCNAKGTKIKNLLVQLNTPESTLQLFYKIVPSERVFGGAKSTIDTLFSDKVEIPPSVSLPANFIPLYEPSTNFYYKMCAEYLNSRGVTNRDFLKYKLGYCIEGAYSNMIVFPNYNSSGKLNFYSTRTFMRANPTKFKNNDISRNIVGFELQLNPRQPLILVESALDAITLRRNASPLYGKQLLSAVKEYILTYEISDIYICLDQDALSDTVEISEYLINNGINIYFVELPVGGDPNSIGYDNMWRLIDRAKPLQVMDVFQTKIQNLLI